MTESRGSLTVLAGPTAVGKGTVSTYIRQHFPEIWLSVSMTTRSMRPGEVEGFHYFFVSESEFQRHIDNDDLLEYATVHGKHRYGTPRWSVEQQLAAGVDVLLEIDLQGARQVRENSPTARFAFLAPPSLDELVRRLEHRGTESPGERERRLETAQLEMAAQDEFDVVIINDTVEQAALKLVDFIKQPRA